MAQDMAAYFNNTFGCVSFAVLAAIPVAPAVSRAQLLEKARLDAKALGFDITQIPGWEEANMSYPE